MFQHYVVKPILSILKRDMSACSLLPFDLDLTVAGQHAMLEDRTTATNLMLRQVISVLISVRSGRGKVEPGLSATINQKKEPLGRIVPVLPKIKTDPQTYRVGCPTGPDFLRVSQC